MKNIFSGVVVEIVQDDLIPDLYTCDIRYGENSMLMDWGGPIEPTPQEILEHILSYGMTALDYGYSGFLLAYELGKDSLENKKRYDSCRDNIISFLTLMRLDQEDLADLWEDYIKFFDPQPYDSLPVHLI